MIQNPFLIIVVLIAIEVAVLFLSEHNFSKRFFKFLPAVFWIYFLPMIASTLNVLPQKSGLYQNLTAYFLPASLLLLLLAVDIPAILKVGGSALLMMFVGSAGIVFGAPIVLFIFKPWLPPEAWSGLGALSASWTGGSANMIAVKEAIGTPDSVFLPMVIVDTVVSYSWMGILITLAVWQNAYDKWNRSNTTVLEELHKRVQTAPPASFLGFKWRSTTGLVVFALLGSVLLVEAGRFFPEFKGISAYTWTVILATTVGISLSFTQAKKWDSYGASKIGYFFLYFVLTSIGARANLTAIFSAPLFIVAGFVLVLIHGLLLLLVSRLTKTPMFLVATASQANIGGPVSAPIVAAVYQPALAPVGLLLGILGNILGTYLGLFCSQLCHLVAKL